MKHEELLDFVAKNPVVGVYGKTADQAKKILRDQYTSIDYLELSLHAENYQSLISFLLRYPMERDLRIAVVTVTRTSTQVLQRLLKTLEELPETSRCILISGVPLPSTITSRSQAVVSSFLSQGATQRLLRARGYTEAESVTMATKIQGDASLLDHASDLDITKSNVLQALAHVSQGSTAALDELAQSWSQIHTDLLLKACREVITERFRFFKESELTPLLTKSGAIVILTKINPRTRPRLVVRAGLLPLIAT